MYMDDDKAGTNEPGDPWAYRVIAYYEDGSDRELREGTHKTWKTPKGLDRFCKEEATKPGVKNVVIRSKYRKHFTSYMPSGTVISGVNW